MAERTQSEGFYEMLWDCDHCETKGLLGKSQRHCPECGAKQNADKRYFPKEGEQTRVDGHKYEGSDRVCPNCQAPQSAKAHNCTNCGAPAGGEEVKGVVTPVAPKQRTRWWIPALIIAAIIAIIVIVYMVFFRTVSKKLTISAHKWERSIGIDEYKNIDHHKWRNEVPSDARSVSCVIKQRSTKKIPDGEDCKMKKVDKKDGTFEQVKTCTPKYRSEPVNDDWCSYTVRGWQEVDRIKTAGAGMVPAWPTAGLPPDQHTETLGARRKGAQREKHMLELGGQSCEVSAAVWKKYADGVAVTVEVRARSEAIVCDSL